MKIVTMTDVQTPATLLHLLLQQPSSLLPIGMLKALAIARAGIYALSPSDWTRLERKPPEIMQFNLTDVCNANCTFCAYRYTEPEGGVMKMDTYENALKQYVDMGGRVVAFHALVGEPLLDPYLFRRLEIASARPEMRRIYLFTNGILLGKNADRILASGIHEVHVSVAGFEKSAFEKIEGARTYEAAIEGLGRLLEKNQKRASPVEIHIEVRGGYEALLTQGFRKRILPLINRDFIYNNIHFLRLFDTWGGLIKEDDLPKGTSLLPLNHVRTRPCTRTFHVVVMQNGDVRACDCRLGKKGKDDELVLGNIWERSLDEMWKSSRIRKIRRGFGENRQADVCRDCRFYFPA